MGRTLNKLTALQVSKASAEGLYLDGGGLYLRISATGSKKWIFRYKRHDMGLGGYPAVMLAGARQKATEARELLARGRRSHPGPQGCGSCERATDAHDLRHGG
jgi:hypothetical protein